VSIPPTRNGRTSFVASSSSIRPEAALGFTLPADWVEVLKISDGGTFGRGEADCRILPLDGLPRFHRELVEYGRKTDDDYPDRYLNIGDNASGDYFALDLDAARSARDGAVVSFSHETLQIQRRWESIAVFVESILSE